MFEMHRVHVMYILIRIDLTHFNQLPNLAQVTFGEEILNRVDIGKRQHIVVALTH